MGTINMPGFLKWFGQLWVMRMVASAVIVWTLWNVWSATGALLPWLILILTWVMEWMAWQQGVFDGARRWDALPESKRKEIREAYFQDSQNER